MIDLSICCALAPPLLVLALVAAACFMLDDALACRVLADGASWASRAVSIEAVPRGRVHSRELDHRRIRECGDIAEIDGRRIGLEVRRLTLSGAGVGPGDASPEN